ncbi:hypothetical protein [Streptomyces sp. NPDC086838]|uniref:hypothetical protein n=1 Tax=Streptomyces sp. NPDC086838 TaxID=3365762 RepID=UPI0037F11080
MAVHEIVPGGCLTPVVQPVPAMPRQFACRKLADGLPVGFRQQHRILIRIGAQEKRRGNSARAEAAWQYLEIGQALATVNGGYGAGRIRQWSRTWRTTPLRYRLQNAVEAFRRSE